MRFPELAKNEGYGRSQLTLFFHFQRSSSGFCAARPCLHDQLSFKLQSREQHDTHLI